MASEASYDITRAFQTTQENLTNEKTLKEPQDLCNNIEIETQSLRKIIPQTR